MGFIKKWLVMQLLMTVLLIGPAAVSQAVEMDADVGIEFTAIDPEPKPKPEPPEKPQKKVIQLPQTGETKSQGFTVMGALVIIVASVFVYKRKGRVTKK